MSITYPPEMLPQAEPGDEVEVIVCNLPWQRVPTCSCDPGFGPPITRLQMLECKLRGGPCSDSYPPQDAQEPPVAA